MGITGASRRVSWRWAATLAGALAGCMSGPGPVGRPSPGPSPSGRDVEIRIGLMVGAGSVDIGAAGPVTLTSPDGSRLGTIPAGETWRVVAGTDGLAIVNGSGPARSRFDALTLAPANARLPLRINGKAYRGVADIFRDRTGLTLVNRLGVESYLVSVVSTELGRRSPAEVAALRAQAVVSRTYALRNLRRRRTQGFDLYATVTDQAYGGLGVETAEARSAVNETRGRVLTYDGGLIEAFYFSTCGGRTADGLEVFRGASRPYLRSVSDLDDNGLAYCSISPRYHWREEWSAEALRASLERYRSNSAGGAAAAGRVQDIRVTQRSSSGRVDEIAVSLAGAEVRVNGHTNIRQALRTAGGDILRSTNFTLVASREVGSVTRLVAEGMGAGHGVGLCQWGAVGRARAGQSYERILASYYPGTRVERRY